LAPSAALKKAFPPASNQYGVGVWPIAHLLVAHELDLNQAKPGSVFGWSAAICDGRIFSVQLAGRAAA
jgi:hypothetical protein